MSIHCNSALVFLDFDITFKSMLYSRRKLYKRRLKTKIKKNNCAGLKKIQK